VTVVNSLKGAPKAPEEPSREIESALRALASKLQALTYDRAQRVGGDNVLLDVVLGDVRLLALWLRRPTPMSLLSPREREIARMVAQGYANKTIASVLEISSWTVASHLRRIYVKLQVSSRAAMATCLLGAVGNELPALPDETLNDDFASDGRLARDKAPLPRSRSGDLFLTAR